MIKIHIEGGSRTFHIHKDLLVAKSGYFKALVNFRNPLPNPNDPLSAAIASMRTIIEVTLKQEDNHDADAIFVVANWVYEGASALTSLKAINTHDLNANRRAQVALTRVYIQADKLLMPALKNDIIDTIHSFSFITLPSLRALQMLKDAIPIETTLERFLMHGLMHWLNGCPDYLKFNANGWHLEVAEVLEGNAELCFEILKMVCCDDMASTGYHNPCEGSRCDYHEHGEDAPAAECIDADDRLRFN